jgi:hypothetical protein
MRQEFKRSVVTFLSLIPLMLLLPNIGFGGCEPCGQSGPVLPPSPYLGTLIVRWVPKCDVGTGCVYIYGVLQNVDNSHNKITIDKKEPILITFEVGQVEFLTVDSTFLIGMNYQFKYNNKCFAVQNADDPYYNTGTIFQVNVVVMQVH